MTPKILSSFIWSYYKSDNKFNKNRTSINYLIYMKRVFIIFIVAIFNLSFFETSLFSQSSQKLLYITGNIYKKDETIAPLKNVELRIENSYTKPVVSNNNGSFRIRWACNTDKQTYILITGSSNYCAKIVPVNIHNYSYVNEYLKLAIYPPRSLEIHIQGFVKNSEGNPIDSVNVFLSDGITIGSTDSIGHFDIVAAKNTLPLKTYLWIEKEKFKNKIIALDFMSLVRDTTVTDICLDYLKTTINFEFQLTRKGIKDQKINDVTISINDSIWGTTDEDGKFSANNIQIPQNCDSLNIKFSHQHYREESIQYYLCDDSLNIYFPFDLEPIKRNLEIEVVQIFQDGRIKPIENAEVTLRGKILNYTNSKGMARFTVSATPTDSLHIRVPQDMFYVPEETSIAIEEEKKYYELAIRKKKVKIEIVTKNTVTGEPVTDVDSLELTFRNTKEFLTIGDTSFTFESDDLVPGEEITIIALTRNYTFDPKKIIVKNDSTFYFRNFLLKKIMYGNLELSSDPDSALIFIDDMSDSFITPVIIEIIEEGEHRIKFAKKGYEGFEKVINVEPNQKNTFHYKLKSLKREEIKEKKWIQFSLEGGLSGWIFRYIHGDKKRWPIPTAYPKLGFNFFFVRLSPVLLKGSFFKGYFYFPDRYNFNINEAELGGITQLGEYSLHITSKYTYLRSWKEVLAKFDGYSLDIKISKNICSKINNVEPLPIIKNYKGLIEVGFERSFKPINRSFKGDFEKENQIYIGYIHRWKNRWVIISHLGYAFPKTKALDEDYKDLVELKNLVRIHLTLSYFLLD